MRLADAHPEIRRCLGAYEAYRKIGYRPEEIYFSTFADGVGMVLRHAGLQHVCAWPWPDMPADVVARWEEAGNLWNGGSTEQEKQDLWDEWLRRNDTVAFVMSLADAGLPLTSEAVLASRRSVH